MMGWNNPGSRRQTILKQASSECDIEYIGNQQYRIEEVYKYPVPKNFQRMNSGIHKYLTPLILMNLIAANIYDVKNITFSCAKWYRDVDMINDNYINMKYNIDYSSKTLQVNKKTLEDFYGTTDDLLIYYFKKSLKFLKEAKLFDYQEINWICVREAEEITVNGTKQLSLRNVHRRATHEEMNFIHGCDDRVSKKIALLNGGVILTDQSKLFGPLSETYKRMYRSELAEQNILFCYKAYEIFATDRDIQRCHQLLKSFDIEEALKDAQKEALIKDLNREFSRKIITNAEKRVAKPDSKYVRLNRKQIKQALNDYKTIAKTVLAKDAFRYNVPQTIDKDDTEYINQYISDNLHVMVNGSQVKIGVDDLEL